MNGQRFSRVEAKPSQEHLSSHCTDFKSEKVIDIDLLLEEVLSVSEGAQLCLFLLVFQLVFGGAEVEDKVLQGEDDPVQR